MASFVENILNDDPKVFFIDNFLSDHECDYIISKATPSFKPSLVSAAKGGTVSPGRTGETTWLSYASDPILRAIAEKSAKLLGANWRQFEQLQIVKYLEGNEYRWHMDSYLFDSERGQRCLKNRGQRMATLLFYLSDVEEGGETGFRELNNMKVQPVKGRALHFANVLPGTNKQHPKSLHAGLPVIKGQKYIANFWLREYPFDKPGTDEQIFGRSLQALAPAPSTNASPPPTTQPTVKLPFYQGIFASNEENRDIGNNPKRLYRLIGDLLGHKRQYGCLFRKELLNESFNLVNDHYIKLENIYPDEIIDSIEKYYLELIQEGAMRSSDRQSDRHCTRNEKVSRILNYDLEPLISRMMTIPMEASYTYGAFYKKDAILPHHLDRDTCALTISLCLHMPEGVEYPIMMEKRVNKKHNGRLPYDVTEDQCAVLNYGKNAFGGFFGCMHGHKRDKCPKDLCCYFMLHYVPKNRAQFDKLMEESIIKNKMEVLK